MTLSLSLSLDTIDLLPVSRNTDTASINLTLTGVNFSSNTDTASYNQQKSDNHHQIQHNRHGLGGDGGGNNAYRLRIDTNSNQQRQDWEIDPAKLVIKSVIARGSFGTVHRGVYDGLDVAGMICDLQFSFLICC